MMNEPKCITDTDGNKKWYLNGVLHREDGPAVEHIDGQYGWYINGKLHREDGPAVYTAHGEKYWFQCGERHRLDGPASIFSNGTTVWYINGSNVTDEITQWAKDNDIDLDNLTYEDKALIKLIWADYGK